MRSEFVGVVGLLGYEPWLTNGSVAVGLALLPDIDFVASFAKFFYFDGVELFRANQRKTVLFDVILSID